VTARHQFVIASIGITRYWDIPGLAQDSFWAWSSSRYGRVVALKTLPFNWTKDQQFYQHLRVAFSDKLLEQGQLGRTVLIGSGPLIQAESLLS
jgi:hypothetical protein